MPAIHDHPLYLARVRAGVGQKALADAVGMNRSSIAAIEEGRTLSPTVDTIKAIETELRLSADTLQAEIVAWDAKRTAKGPQLSPYQVQVLAMRPADIRVQYASFVEWREQFAASPTAFASMLGVNRAVVAKYEQGIRQRGMPGTLAHALVSVLGITNDYLLAISALPPDGD